jgi:hypothetical protein
LLGVSWQSATGTRRSSGGAFQVSQILLKPEERKMQARSITVLSAGLLAMSLPLPANAGDKVTGKNMDAQTLSEVSAVVPDKPNHSFKQLTLMWKSTSPNPDFANFWSSAVEQQDIVGPDTASKGYGTAHYPNGDVSYFSWEGASKLTPKEAGAFEVAGQGKFAWTGGTGTHNVTGPGTYTCKFTQSGGGCDWQGEAENQSAAVGSSTAPSTTPNK